jgi:hypothetical protein
MAGVCGRTEVNGNECVQLTSGFALPTGIVAGDCEHAEKGR